MGRRTTSWKATKTILGVVRFVSVTAPLAALPLACGSSGTIVFGVKSELAVGTSITALRAALRADGAALDSQTITVGQLAFPLEFSSGPLDDGSLVELELTAFQGSEPVVVASGATTVVGGATRLFEMELQTECVRVECPTAETCDEGVCVSAAKTPDELPDYSEGWAGTKPSAKCEPGGEPEVIAGSGQADFHGISSGEVLQVEQGSQGGYHVWIAARLRNLKQSGSVTTVSGHFPALGYEPPPMSVVFTFDPDEGDYCKIYGLRFRLDDEAHPIETLLGQVLEVTVGIQDQDGTAGESTVSVKLSDSFI